MLANRIKRVMFLVFIAMLIVSFCSAETSEKKEFVIGVENIEYLPFYSVDPKNPEEYIGYGRELLDAFAQKKGYVFHYYPLPIARLFQEFLGGMYDFKFPDNSIWSEDDKKGKTIYYSNAVNDYTDGIMVHADNSKDITLEKLAVVGTVRGFTAWEYLDLIRAGKLQFVENNTLLGLLQQVEMKRIDGAYFNIAVAEKSIRDSGGMVKNVVFASNLPHTSSSYKLSTLKHPKIIEELNSFLEENKELVIELHNKYQIKLPAGLEQLASETFSGACSK